MGSKLLYSVSVKTKCLRLMKSALMLVSQVHLPNLTNFMIRERPYSSSTSYTFPFLPGGPLHLGDIEDVDGSLCVACPRHGFAFDLVHGISRLPPVSCETRSLAALSHSEMPYCMCLRHGASRRDRFQPPLIRCS